MTPTIRPVRVILALACACVLGGCAGSNVYVGTTWGAPWGGVGIGTTVPIGYGRPCCWEEDAQEEDAAPVAAADSAAEAIDTVHR